MSRLRGWSNEFGDAGRVVNHPALSPTDRAAAPASTNKRPGISSRDPRAITPPARTLAPEWFGLRLTPAQPEEEDDPCSQLQKSAPFR